MSSMSSEASALDSLHFDNRHARALPIDPELRNFVRDAVPNACFSHVAPEPLIAPTLVSASGPALALLGLSESDAAAPKAVAQLGGSATIPGADYLAACYCGFQFGAFSGQLGDGAAISVGEVLVPARLTAASQAAAPAASSSPSPLFAPAPTPASLGVPQRAELQLKGAGSTPYSRAADGRKVLRSSLREHLASEAMHALGVPTTRSAAIIVSGAGAGSPAPVPPAGSTAPPRATATRVQRDPVYSGRVISERCAVVARVAPTFVRFGSLELALPRDVMTGRSGPSAGNGRPVAALLHHTLALHFPGSARAVAVAPESYVSAAARAAVPALADKADAACALSLSAVPASFAVATPSVDGGELTVAVPAEGEPDPLNLREWLGVGAVVNVSSLRRAYLAWVAEVARRTAVLVAQWQRVGFTHGVLNTDNMSVAGLTIDFGPYGWQDAFNLAHVPNGSDHDGRYDWEAQTSICEWNVAKLAITLSMTPLPLALLDEPSRAKIIASPASDAPVGAVPNAGSFLPAEAAAAARAVFRAEYALAAGQMWAGKLGLLRCDDLLLLAGAADAPARTKRALELGESLQQLMHESGADYTLTMRELSAVPTATHAALRARLEGAQAGSDVSATDAAAASEAAATAILEKVLSLCLSAADYNKRRSASMPDESVEDLEGQISKVATLGAKHPAFAEALDMHKRTAARKLAAWARFSASKELTEKDKHTKDEKEWGQWLEAYRARLAEDEALIIAAALSPDASASLPLPPALATALSDEAVRAGAVRVLAETAPSRATLGAAAVDAADAADAGSSRAAVEAAAALVEWVYDMRTRSQRSHNPLFTLRTWAAQEAIAAAERGNADETRALQYVLEDPYDHEGAESGLPNPDVTVEHTDFSRMEPSFNAEAFANLVKSWRRRLAMLPPISNTDICVTCSS